MAPVSAYRSRLLVKRVMDELVCLTVLHYAAFVTIKHRWSFPLHSVDMIDINRMALMIALPASVHCKATDEDNLWLRILQTSSC